MSRTKQLIEVYSNYISIPWRRDEAPAQRIIFCVYNEAEELKIRARIDEFELATRQAGHDWYLFDLTESFACWMLSQKYAGKYFQNPDLLKTLLPENYQQHITRSFAEFYEKNNIDDNSVVTLMGVGSLFGFSKVRDVVDSLSSIVAGRLVVLFPGSYENNNYRLLDGYDGWNYLAVPLTADASL
ncbi:conserved hypothetical protein [Desulfonatronospira thiodismutans ASO3-1]|uniref:DUF1788 domain-containing protein n=1 Tax=Desulfonatronospira thiodismutans ASO3-1 TaxID=555779 RepID=D6SJQ8_9BACT|nr:MULTISPECIES: BREX protein BrxB domain-containing protein [Desulfonatronospira]EFI36111.1 conserved hypothetical protein [Desulfonatronospira thiodismutans ASO3-1]RQD73045.1 MAG: DUF1788 domain-containing protein [Desulfonatronospira sp. MSAO_Bac3]